MAKVDLLLNHIMKKLTSEQYVSVNKARSNCILSTDSIHVSCLVYKKLAVIIYLLNILPCKVI